LHAVSSFSEESSANNVCAAFVPPQTDMSVSDDYRTVKGSDMMSDIYLGMQFKYPVQGFFQNNSGMAQAMHAYCHNILKGQDTGGARLLDLYGGVGTFGIINSKLFEDVLVLESDKKAVEAASLNITLNGALNVRVEARDASRLPDYGFDGPLFAVTDPPRAGMHPRVVKALDRSKAKTIIYVSCNPGQLRRDLPRFRGYEIGSAALFDLFPQTPHLEAVVELARKDGA